MNKLAIIESSQTQLKITKLSAIPLVLSTDNTSHLLIIYNPHLNWSARECTPQDSTAIVDIYTADLITPAMSRISESIIILTPQ